MLPRTKEYLLITLGGYYGIDSLFKKLKREITKNLSCFSYINYVWKTKCSFGRFLLIAMSQVTQWWRNKELEYYHFTTSNGYRHRSYHQWLLMLQKKRQPDFTPRGGGSHQYLEICTASLQRGWKPQIRLSSRLN